MAKINEDGTIEGEAKVVGEETGNKKTDEAETKPSKLKKGLKIAGAVLGAIGVVGVSVFVGTKIK